MFFTGNIAKLPGIRRKNRGNALLGWDFIGFFMKDNDAIFILILIHFASF